MRMPLTVTLRSGPSVTLPLTSCATLALAWPLEPLPAARAGWGTLSAARDDQAAAGPLPTPARGACQRRGREAGARPAGWARQELPCTAPAPCPGARRVTRRQAPAAGCPGRELMPRGERHPPAAARTTATRPGRRLQGRSPGFPAAFSCIVLRALRWGKHGGRRQTRQRCAGSSAAGSQARSTRAQLRPEPSTGRGPAGGASRASNVSVTIGWQRAAGRRCRPPGWVCASKLRCAEPARWRAPGRDRARNGTGPATGVLTQHALCSCAAPHLCSLARTCA
jgi:hypothetical protein